MQTLRGRIARLEAKFRPRGPVTYVVHSREEVEALRAGNEDARHAVILIAEPCKKPPWAGLSAEQQASFAGEEQSLNSSEYPALSRAEVEEDPLEA